MKKTLLVADDHPIILYGLESFFGETHPRYEVIASAADGLKAWDYLEAYAPHVAILDMDMPQLDGLAVAQLAKEQASNSKVVLFSSFLCQEALNKGLVLNVKGFLPKESFRRELENCLDTVCQDQTYISPLLSEKLLRSPTATSSAVPSSLPWHLLTKQEKQILKHIAQGKTTPEIAELLFISVRTIHKHRENIQRKLDLKGRFSLIALAMEYKKELA